MRGGTRGKIADYEERQNISIRPPRAGRDFGKQGDLLMIFKISIRPPRAGRDVAGVYSAPFVGISIRPPRAGRDVVR